MQITDITNSATNDLDLCKNHKRIVHNDNMNLIERKNNEKAIDLTSLVLFSIYFSFDIYHFWYLFFQLN
jgi:hypothetical protein